MSSQNDVAAAHATVPLQFPEASSLPPQTRELPYSSALVQPRSAQLDAEKKVSLFGALVGEGMGVKATVSVQTSVPNDADKTASADDLLNSRSASRLQAYPSHSAKNVTVKEFTPVSFVSLQLS